MMNGKTRRVFLRGLVVWWVIAAAEIAHGVFRRMVLESVLDERSTHQLGVAIGAALILLIAWMFIGWIGAKRRTTLLALGMMWVVLMLSFEIGVGRGVMGYSWARILSDYDVSRGGLLGFGMLFLAAAPLLAAHLRHPAGVGKRSRPVSVRARL